MLSIYVDMDFRERNEKHEVLLLTVHATSKGEFVRVMLPSLLSVSHSLPVRVL